MENSVILQNIENQIIESNQFLKSQKLENFLEEDIDEINELKKAIKPIFSHLKKLDLSDLIDFYKKEIEIGLGKLHYLLENEKIVEKIKKLNINQPTKIVYEIHDRYENMLVATI